MEEKLSKKTKLAYGIGSLGYSTVCQSMSNFIMFFGTAIIGLSGSLVGVCVALASVWDAITDPLVGFFSDRQTERGKSRNCYMIISSITMCVFVMLIWLTPNFKTSIASGAWLFFMLVLFETAETLYATPYYALGYELSLDKNENTSLQNYKSIFNIIGTILPSLLLVVFTSNADFSLSNASRSSFAKIGLVCSALCIACSLITKKFVKGEIHTQKTINPSANKSTFISEFFSIFKEKSCRNVILGYCASMIATSLITSIGLHVFTYSFHYNSIQIAFVMASLLFGSIISQMFVYKLSKKIGKLKALIKFMLIVIASVLLILILFYLRILLSKTLVFCLLLFFMFCCGIGSGALYSLPTSIFCDIIQKQNKNNRIQKTATMSGAMSFAFKISNSLSMFCVGSMLDIIKFNSSSPVQPLAVQNSLGNILLLGILLSISMAISLFEKGIPDSVPKQNKHKKV